MKHFFVLRRYRLAWFALPVAMLISQITAAQTLSSLMYFNGSSAAGGVALGTDGALYGVASESTFGRGAIAGLIYRASTDSSQPIATIYQYGQLGVFAGGGPRGTLARDAAGNFYGVTAYNTIDATFGIPSGSGTVFTLTPSGAYTRLHLFADPISLLPTTNIDGAQPTASLLLASDGFLYGSTTSGGANGNGTIFKIATDGSGFAVLHTFSATTALNSDGHAVNSDGIPSQTRLLQANNGDLYGTTTSGGENGTGAIFRLHRDGSGFAVIWTFDVSPITDITTVTLKTNATGAYPASGLLQASDGRLYGTTTQQGAIGYGNVYRIADDGSEFTVLHSFDLTNGGNPSGELIVAHDGTIVGTTTAGATQSDGVTAGSGTLYSMSLDGTTFNTLYVFGVDGANPTTGVIQSSDGSFFGTTASGGPFAQGTVFKFGTPTNAPAQGTPPPFTDSGAISWWLLVALGLLTTIRKRARFADERLATRE